MSKLDKEQVIERFTAAYTKANGKAPTIEAKGGWYTVDGGKNMRLAQVEELTAELSQQKVEKKAPVKPAKETTVKAKAPKKAVKKSKVQSAFSVKELWASQIQAKNPGSQQPR
ncbi:MAG: hypothetical protein ACI88A_004892 [Paraglaciecola sp.]|jgi:hypothetical protein